MATFPFDFAIASAAEPAQPSAKPPAPPERVPDKLSDAAAIIDLVARFDDAVNRKDADEFGRLWADDGIWEISEPNRLHIVGRKAIVQTWRNMLAGTEWLFRGSFMGVVDIDGDSATGRWPCVETGTFKATETERSRGYDNRALYEDRYVKAGGKWFFHHRRYHYLWLPTNHFRAGRCRSGTKSIRKQIEREVIRRNQNEFAHHFVHRRLSF